MDEMDEKGGKGGKGGEGGWGGSEGGSGGSGGGSGGGCSAYECICSCEWWREGKKKQQHGFLNEQQFCARPREGDGIDKSVIPKYQFLLLQWGGWGEGGQEQGEGRERASF